MTFIPGKPPVLHIKDDNLVEIESIDLSSVSVAFLLLLWLSQLFTICPPF